MNANKSVLHGAVYFMLARYTNCSLRLEVDNIQHSRFTLSFFFFFFSVFHSRPGGPLGHLLCRGLSQCPFFVFPTRWLWWGLNPRPSDYQADVLPPDHPSNDKYHSHTINQPALVPPGCGCSTLYRTVGLHYLMIYTIVIHYLMIYTIVIQ